MKMIDTTQRFESWDAAAGTALDAGNGLHVPSPLQSLWSWITRRLADPLVFVDENGDKYLLGQVQDRKPYWKFFKVQSETQLKRIVGS